MTRNQQFRALFSQADRLSAWVHSMPSRPGWPKPAAHLEDQALPKKCGHFAGKQLVSQQEMVQKIEAMIEARGDPDFFILAGCDTSAIADRLTPFAEYNRFVGLPEAVAREARLTRYDTRCATPHDGNERARLAFMAALKALGESQ